MKVLIVIGAVRLGSLDCRVVRAAPCPVLGLKVRRIESAAFLGMGHPQRAIVDAAKRLAVDLLLVGAGEPQGARSHLLGSISEKVVRCAPCSVLVVRARVSLPRWM